MALLANRPSQTVNFTDFVQKCGEVAESNLLHILQALTENVMYNKGRGVSSRNGKQKVISCV